MRPTDDADEGSCKRKLLLQPEEQGVLATQLDLTSD